MIKTFTAAAFVFLCTATAAAASDPFANPVHDCHPCRFSPGPGQPDLALTFVFEGSGDGKVLTAFAVTPAGSPTQRIPTGNIAVSDFPDGFFMDDSDMNFDGMRDLSLTTFQASGGNINAEYWIYQPKSHDFVPLERVGDGDNGDFALTTAPNHELDSRSQDGMAGFTDYRYRVTGHRAVAVRKEVVDVENGLAIDVTYDLTVNPNRQLTRRVIGFAGDTPARTAFLKRLDAAAKRADALFKRGDKAGAIAVLAPVLKDKDLNRLTSSYPITNDPSDLRIVGQVNNYGYYLAEAGRWKDAIDILASVIDVDANRTVAYLNLADAQYADGQKTEAKANYATYQKRMTAAGAAARIPPRVAARMR